MYIKKEIDPEYFADFDGGWTLAEASVIRSFRYLKDGPINVLEIGGGKSTILFRKILDILHPGSNLYCIEHNRSYIHENINVNYITYDLPSYYEPAENHSDTTVYQYIDKVNLDGLPIFDFIIIDGPNGVARSRWYQRLINLITPGTIVLIDDYHHYKEFNIQLNINMKYIPIVEFCISEKFILGGQINYGLEPINLLKDYHYNKTFKVIKIT